MAALIDRVTVAITAADSVFTGAGSYVTVTNLDGAGIIYFRVDGTAASAADENYAVPAIAGAYKTVPIGSLKTVSHIATVAALATIELHDNPPCYCH